MRYSEAVDAYAKAELARSEAVLEDMLQQSKQLQAEYVSAPGSLAWEALLPAISAAVLNVKVAEAHREARSFISIRDYAAAATRLAQLDLADVPQVSITELEEARRVLQEVLAVIEAKEMVAKQTWDEAMTAYELRDAEEVRRLLRILKAEYGNTKFYLQLPEPQMQKLEAFSKSAPSEETEAGRLGEGQGEE